MDRVRAAVMAAVSFILSLLLTGCVTGRVGCERLPDGHFNCSGDIGGTSPEQRG